MVFMEVDRHTTAEGRAFHQDAHGGKKVELSAGGMTQKFLARLAEMRLKITSRPGESPRRYGK